MDKRPKGKEIRDKNRTERVKVKGVWRMWIELEREEGEKKNKRKEMKKRTAEEAEEKNRGGKRQNFR